MDALTLWWEAVFKLGRAGSRTVVCDPGDDALIVELARRGYRILVLHDGGFPVEALRAKLRSLGLSSQLMGAQTYSGDGEVALVDHFYELWIFVEAPIQGLLDRARRSLKTGGLVLWEDSTSAEIVATEPPRLWPRGVDGLQL